MWLCENHDIGVKLWGRPDKLVLFKLKNELDRGICRAYTLSVGHWRDYIPGELAIFNPILHRDINDVKQVVIEPELETEILELYPGEFIIERVNPW